MPKKFRKKDAEKVKRDKELKEVDKIYEQEDYLCGMLNRTLDKSEITTEKILDAFGDSFDNDAYDADPWGEIERRFYELGLEASRKSIKYFTKEQMLELLDPDKFLKKGYQRMTADELKKIYIEKRQKEIDKEKKS